MGTLDISKGVEVTQIITRRGIPGAANSAATAAHIDKTTDAHDASAVSYDPSGDSWTSTNLQDLGGEAAGRLDAAEGDIVTAQSTADAAYTPGGTDVAVADGGTGASDAAAARTNLGVGEVDNTSDATKPISTATQAALNIRLQGRPVTAGFEPVARDLLKSPALVFPASGTLCLTAWTAPDVRTLGTIQLWSPVAAGATPSLIRIGLYRVSDLNLTEQLAATANTPAGLSNNLGNGNFISFTSTYTTAPGDQLAWGLLVVTAAALPQLPALIPGDHVGWDQLMGRQSAGLDPWRTRSVSGLSDLPTTFPQAVGSVVTRGYYCVLSP